MYVNEKNPETIIAKQFDALTRYLRIQLLQDDGTPYNLKERRVQFNARKRSGKYIMNDAVIDDAENGFFSVELTDQTLAEGDTTLLADITIFGENNRQILTTRTFNIRVEKTVRNDKATESSNEYSSVVILFQDVWDMRDVIKGIRDRFGEQQDGISEDDEVAGFSVFSALNKIWNYLKTQSTAGIVDVVNAILGLVKRIDLNTTQRVWIYDKPGTYTFIVPQGVRQIFITACGAGGGGGGAHLAPTVSGVQVGNGGGGGAAIVKKSFAVTPGQSITITVREGGAGGSGGSGGSGGATTIGILITLNGGGGGAASRVANGSNTNPTPALSGGDGGGIGSTQNIPAGNGIGGIGSGLGGVNFGLGGYGNGSGGGSLGNGGEGSPAAGANGRNGTLGGGGAGGREGSPAGRGGRGGDGFVMIETSAGG